MAITTARTSTNGRQAPDGTSPPRPRAVPVRHRQRPLIVIGVLLVVGFALAFTDASLHLGTHQEVLVVDQPVAAGQILSPGDLRPARLSSGSGVQAGPAGDESTVVGRRVAVPLVAGALLTPGEVGSPPPVGSGSDVVAVGLKAGAYPPEVAAGDRVDVVPVRVCNNNGVTTSGRLGLWPGGNGR